MNKSRFVLWTCVYAFMSVPAYGISLGVLTNTNGTIQSGDKIFSNFVISSFSSADPTDVGDIDVIPVTVAGNHGLRFVGPFSGATTQVNNTILVELGFYHIDFDVQTTDPNVQIQDVNHSWAFTHFGQGLLNFALGTEVQSCPGPFSCTGPGEFDGVSIDTSLHGIPFCPLIPSPGISPRKQFSRTSPTFCTSRMTLPSSRGAFLMTRRRFIRHS